MIGEESMTALITRLKTEVEVGGGLATLPCPLCGLPRCQRSEYIRCSKCGVNWLPGEDKEKNPKIARFNAMVASLQSSKKKAAVEPADV